MAQTARRRVVIVGGGFGGIEAARGLAESDVEITLVDRRNHYLFQPLLYQVATAGLNPADIAAPIRSILRHQDNVTVLLGEVVAVDLEGSSLVMADGAALTYDYLVLAAGTHHSYFGNDQWEAHAPGLKSVEDALEIRRRVLMAFERAERSTAGSDRNAELTFVVVGGGPTGVEMAGAIAEIAFKVMRRDFRTNRPGRCQGHPSRGRRPGSPDLSAFVEQKSTKATRAARSRGSNRNPRGERRRRWSDHEYGTDREQDGGVGCRQHRGAGGVHAGG